MDDAHIYCTRDQMRDELTSLLRFVLDLLGDYGLTDFYLELSTKDPKKFVGSDETVGGSDQRAGRGGRRLGPRAGARPGRRGVLRPQDLGAGQGRAGPQLADVDHPAGLQLPRAFRVGVHRRRRQPSAAGDDPPRAVRVDRAVLRHPHRALRRRVPGVAGTGTGGRHPRRRGPHPVSQRPCHSIEDARHPGRGRRQRRPDGQEDREPHQPEGAVHAGGRRPRRRGRRRQFPFRRPHPDQRRATDEARWPPSPMGRNRENATPTAELVRRRSSRGREPARS